MMAAIILAKYTLLVRALISVTMVTITSRESRRANGIIPMTFKRPRRKPADIAIFGSQNSLNYGW